MVVVAPESPQQEEVLVLLRQSDAHAQALYPPESNHLMDVDALAAPNVRFFVARIDGKAVGCGALVLGRAGKAELKRMFVDPKARGRGVGRAVLQAIETAAAAESVRAIRLETGIRSHEALALYRRSGYRERGPFGAYNSDPLSVFMQKNVTRT
jgi:putative acetyltransferase